MASDRILTVEDDSFERDVLQSDLPVLVDFWAEWCAPCKAVAPVLEELAAEMAGRVRFAKLDVGVSQQVASRLRVQSFPTFILFKNGQPADRAVGAMSKAGFRGFLDKNL
jgi:thioredoxin 1